MAKKVSFWQSFKSVFPVLFSPKFWGVVLTALAYYFSKYGFVLDPQACSEFILFVVGGGTTVGVVDSVARKVGGDW